MAKIQPTVPKGWQERLTFAGASIDADFGTYPSIASALAAITTDRRAKGRQVAICDSSGKAMIYWWDTDDLTDNGLHLMENGLTSVSIPDVNGLSDALTSKQPIDIVQLIAPKEGEVVHMTDDATVLKVDVATALLSITISLPVNPYNGQKVMIVFGGAISGGNIVILNTITITANATIVQPIEPTQVYSGDCLGYVFTNNNWMSL